MTRILCMPSIDEGLGKKLFFRPLCHFAPSVISTEGRNLALQSTARFLPEPALSEVEGVEMTMLFGSGSSGLGALNMGIRTKQDPSRRSG